MDLSTEIKSDGSRDRTDKVNTILLISKLDVGGKDTGQLVIMSLEMTILPAGQTRRPTVHRG